MEPVSEWIRKTIDSIDWSTFTRPIIGSLVGSLIGMVIGWFVLFRRRMIELRKLQRGDSDDILFQTHTLIPVAGTDDVVLAFRNVGPRTTVNSLYDNIAARDLLHRLSDKTTLMNPILQTEGTAGFEVLNTAFGYIAGFLAVSPFERDIWLFTMTCEDRQVVRKKCIRCFLIRPADLEKFMDWKWCTTHVRVEKLWHGLRVAALHRIAMCWKEERELMRRQRDTESADSANLVNVQFRHERVREISIGINVNEKSIGEPYTVNWPALVKKLKEMGLEVREE